MKRTLVVWAVLALVAIGGAGLAIAADPKPATKMTDDLAALHDDYVASIAARVPLDVMDSMLPVADDLVTIDATATDDPNVLAAHLHALGARDVAVGGWRVSARVPVGALPSLQTLTSLRFAWPAYSATNVGAVTSQGDVAMRADVARNRFGLDGTGVTIGVLSDSFGCIAGGVATGMANGDLPTVTVLQEDAPCTNGTDEGRAMLEIVHDVAPGAPLAFATANLGMASFAANIRALRDAGAKVIVDDVFYFAEPMFQDGIIAQAVNDVVASGVAYFSSAGNQARQGYDTTFVPGTVYTAADPRLGGSATFLGGTAHSFGSTPFQTFTLGGGTSFTMVLQWDSPFFSVSGPPGTLTDVDVYVLNAAGTQVLFGATSNNIASGDPVEILRVSCAGPGSCSAALLFVKHTGPNPGRFKYVLLQASSVTTTPRLNSGTIYGHANALGAVAVGAARYQQTPAFGVSPAVLEPFSSVGTTPILFGLSGNRLATPDLRASKPEIVAPDGADTSFFGSDSDTDGFPNFFGTSAAAPHAAAVGALMLQAVPTLTPAQIRTALQNTALDMAAPGFDNDTGSGLIQADAALAAAGAKVPTTTSLTSSANPAVAGQPVTVTAHVSVSVAEAITPSGMVTFFEGATMLGTAVLDLAGTGSFTTNTLTPGMHAITAQYGGDTNSGASTSAPLTETIAQANTTTAITSSGNPAIFGQAVTFTATVSPVAPGAGTPTGTVTFLHGPVLLGAAVLNGMGQAVFTTSTLPVGNNPIAAAYVGDARENASASALLTQTIVPAASSTAVTASPIQSAFGRVVTLTATVKTVTPSSGTPTGSVIFTVDGNPLSAAQLNAGGQATLTTSALAAGSRVIVASYVGDANVVPSASSPLTLLVAKAATTTTLTSSPSAIVTGQPLTLTATVGLVAPSTGAPTGSVTFRDGTAVLGTVLLTPDGGVATASLTTALRAGAHSLTAGFSGDANTNASTSPARTQTATKASTTITLTTSTSAAVVGQDVTFTATLGVVAPGTGTPTGGVMFLNGAVALGTVTPDATGVATLTRSALTLGPHAITARYVGDTGFDAVTSSALTVTIVKASTVTTVTGSANPAAWHQPVTLTAAVSVVAPGSGTPTGLVTFFNGPATLGTAALIAGHAALTTSALTVGDHTITASYAGAATFNGSVSTVLTESVVPAPSATTLTASPNSAVTGRPVMLTAKVAVAPPVTGTPTGTVTFFDGPTPLGNATLVAGKATLTTGALGVAAHALTAGYLGDGNVAASTSSSVTETIAQAATTTSLTSSANPSVTGRAVTFTAKVTVVAPGTGTPTGSVTFMDGATPLGTVALDATRQATLTTSSLVVGAHPITAVYGGDAGYATSTSPALTETIGKAATKTTLVSSGSPAVHGVPVTFTATVSVIAPGAGAPTGTVTFLDGATTLGTVMLGPAGQASFTTGSLVAGARAITARYAGDSGFAPSASAALSETVTKASTATALATSVTAAVVGQPVLLTAVVSVNPPGAGTPTGGVMFLNGAAVLGTGTLTAAGQAVFTTSSLTLGAHTITARYAGDPSFATSTSSALTVTVAKAATTMSVTAPASTVAHHQPVTLTATVAVVSPGSGAPMGTVTFFNGPASLGTGALNAMGHATLTTSTLTLGDHDITASYGGSASFNGSVSTVFTERVTRANSATALTATPNPAVVGRPVVLTATVSLVIPGVPAPTGTVTFFDGPTELDTRPLSPAHQATLTTSGLAVGAHAVTATYNGDSNVASSLSNAVTETISKGNTTTTLTSSANPASVGQTLTLTATVNVVAPAAGLPTGIVTFMEGATPLGTATLSDTRQATLTIGGFALGAHSLTAIYGGDASFGASSSTLLTERITNLPPAITSANTVTFVPGLAGQTFTVTTTSMPTDTITRTGPLPGGVTFTDNHDNTATIAGTPLAGTQSHSPYAWVVTAANGTPPNAVQPFSFRIVCPTITVSGSIAALTFNTPMPAAAFTQAGGNGTITWSASGLPAGTAIDAASGQVTGTPTATGTFAVTITATDAGGCPGSVQPSVTVAPVVAGLTYNGLVDNTQFVITGGTTVSPTTPFVGGTSRLGGDALPNGGVKATAGTFPTMAGGSVTIAADGTFIYTPKANPGAAPTASDSFTYTVVSNTGGGAAIPSAPATATLTLAGRVWYVKNNGAAGNGQSQSTFNTLAAAVGASTANDTIFVYQGGGTTANLTTAAALKTGQRLIGQGAALVVNGQPLVPAGGFPVLGNTVTLASGVTLAGFDLSTGAAAGLSGAGVAGVTVAMRDLTTTTGTAVSITGNGNSGTLSFRKISASGGSNGIVVQNLAGSFTVNGDGANTSVGGNGSGGTISNMTGADSTAQTAPFAGVGVYLNNVQNITLRRMTINGANQNYGIRGFAVNGFTLEYCTVSGTNGTAAILDAPEEAGEGSIYFGNSTTNGLSTSAVFTGNVIQGGRARNLSITNTTAGLTTLMFKGNTFGLNQNFIDADQSLAVEAIGSGTRISAIVGGAGGNDANVFMGAPGDLVSFTGQADTAVDVVFQQNALSNIHAQNIVGGGGMTLATQGAMTFDVESNAFSGADGDALTLFKANGGALLSGVVRNNRIGASGVADSGSKGGSGILVSAEGAGLLGLTIADNTIVQYSGAGIYADNTGGSYAANFTITGNTTSQPGPEAFAGLVLTNGSAGSNDTINVCAKITGNSFGAGDPTNTSDALIVASGAGGGPGHTFNLPGYAGSTIADVVGFLGANNPPPAATVFAVRTDAPVTAAAFTGTGTSCPTPP